MAAQGWPGLSCDEEVWMRSFWGSQSRRAKKGRRSLRGSPAEIVEAVVSVVAEAEGLEPPSAFARRISSAVPYQLGLRLRMRTPPETEPRESTHRFYLFPIGAPGFEPGTSATRTQRSTGLSHAPHHFQPRTGWDSNPRGLSPTRFPIVRLKPLGHPSLAWVRRYGGGGIRTHAGLAGPTP